MKTFFYTKKVLSYLKKCNKYYSTSDLPKIPDCNYSPLPYEGYSYDRIHKIRNEKVMATFTQHYQKPLLLNEGKMQWLFDETGKRYLDMFGGIATISVGHCHPKVVEAAEKQLKTLWHSSNLYHHPKLAEYVEALTATFPNHLNVVYLVNSGTEANDLAIMLARHYTKNHEIISLQNCYHGMSSHMMSISSLTSYRYNIPFASNIRQVMLPDVFKGPWGGKKCRDCIVLSTRDCDCSDTCEASENYYKQISELLKYSIPPGCMAGFIVEPIQGVGGVVQFPKGYLKKATELVHKNGGLLIADEVQTGFGRTGEHFWGFEMHDIKPDIVTMAKGIGNGFPMGAVVTTSEIAKTLNCSSHFNTFGGNALACSVALSVLKVIQEEETQKRSDMVGRLLLTELEKLRDEFECVGDIRGKGLMIGAEIVKDKESKEPLEMENIFKIWEDCRTMGVLMGRGGFHGNVGVTIPGVQEY